MPVAFSPPFQLTKLAPHTSPHNRLDYSEYMKATRILNAQHTMTNDAYQMPLKSP